MNTDYIKYIEKWIFIINKIIKKTNYNYDSKNYDSNEWRLNSIKWENDFIESILDNTWEKINSNDMYHYYNKKEIETILVVPHSNRNWFDLWVIYKNLFFPINIKISNWQTADNLFWVKVLNYLLFWEYSLDKYWTHIPINVDEVEIAKKIAKIYKEKNLENFSSFFNIKKPRDYFFLSINKINNDIKIIPFLNVDSEFIKTNPKNAFQINLSNIDNNFLKNNDFSNNIKKIIHKYYEYTEKKAQPYMLLKWLIK